VETTFKPKILQIPPYGMATTQLKINVNEKAVPHPQSLFIHANASFPPETITNNQYLEEKNILPKATKNTTDRSALVVDIKDKLTYPQKFMELWNTYSSPMTFIYGILAGIAPFIYDTIRKRLKKAKEYELP
jgi:hypothetical protein